MTKVGRLLVVVTLGLSACHAQRPTVATVPPGRKTTAAPTTTATQQAPGRSDVDADAARPPLVEMVQTGHDPCEARPVSDPLTPNSPRMLLLTERPCKKPLRGPLLPPGAFHL